VTSNHATYFSNLLNFPFFVTAQFAKEIAQFMMPVFAFSQS